MNAHTICPNCAAVRRFKHTKRTETYSIRGEDFSFPVQVQICEICGETLFDEARDQAITIKAYEEYRRRKGFLSPSEIQGIRNQYGLSQRAFAKLLGVAQPTIARYEGGSLQDEAHDRLIRVYSKPQNMKSLMDERGHLVAPTQIRKAKEYVQTCGLMRWLDIDSLMHRGPDEYTGYRPFEFFKYAKAVLWFCWNLKSVPTTKMNKLLFYADYISFKTHSVSITGTAYRKLQYGPVPEHYGTLRDLLEIEGYIALNEKIYPEYVAVEYVPGPRAMEVEFDLNEEEVLIFEIVSQLFGNCSAMEISVRSHKERAWLETPDRALISYMFAEFLTGIE